jgi:hypothetical protein
MRRSKLFFFKLLFLAFCQEAEDNLLTAKQIESLVFTVVGVAIAFLLTASLLFGVCQCAIATRYKVQTNFCYLGSR